jgi:NAD(P)-dependent dehydrogenase (short-subunit alcohol dehydrogenase family)
VGGVARHLYSAHEENEVSHQTAVITGAASGIGLALAQALATRGHRVVVADIEMERAEDRVAAIRAAGGDAVAMFVDHADRASLMMLADRSFDHLGHVDLVIANAGVGAGGPLFRTPERNIDWVLAVNLTGPIHLSQAFLPRMIDQHGASRFVITASEHAVGLPHRGGQASIYTVSKHGALGVAETLRRDLASTSVAVSVICPGLVTTDIWNPFRNRHDRFGGARLMSERPDSQIGLEPEIAAERILAGMAANEFYLFTHGKDVAEVHATRAREIEAALDRFEANYGAEA